MVVWSGRMGSGDPRKIVPETLVQVMVSGPGLTVALEIAFLREPGPESSVFETTKSAAVSLNCRPQTATITITARRLLVVQLERIPGEDIDGSKLLPDC